MEQYSSGEVCRLLGIKPHVLRYWEQEISLLSSRKSGTGRRIYSDHDLQLLFRLRFLLQDKRFTIEGARRQIWADLDSPSLDLKSRIAAVRSDLLLALVSVQQQKNKLESGLQPGSSPPG